MECPIYEKGLTPVWYDRTGRILPTKWFYACDILIFSLTISSEIPHVIKPTHSFWIRFLDRSNRFEVMNVLKHSNKIKRISNELKRTFGFETNNWQRKHEMFSEYVLIP